MKKKNRTNLLNNVVKAINSVSTTAAKNKVVKGHAKVLNAQAKGIKNLSKASLVEAKQGIAKTRARSAAVTASVGSMATSKVAANQAAAGLKSWNDIINGNPEPAEGTGKAEMPEDQDDTYPVGNY